LLPLECDVLASKLIQEAIFFHGFSTTLLRKQLIYFEEGLPRGWLVFSKNTVKQTRPDMTVPNIGAQRPSTALRRSDGLSAIASLRHHWPEYLMEVGELGLYLLVACVVATLLEHPASIVRQSVSSGVARRVLMGLVMGATAIAIVISPWGKRSGGHFNPAITFTFIGWGKWSFGMRVSMSSRSSWAPLVVSLLPDTCCEARLAIMRYVMR